MKTLFIAGGSASGKTWLADALASRIGDCTRVSQDSFYCDRPSGSGAGDRHHFDFDRPEAIHWSEMAEALDTLKAGRDATIPIYDFSVSLRNGAETLHSTGDILIVDGTLVLHDALMRERADISVFVRAPEALRRERRERRDVEERGRDLADVRRQLADQVFPAHDEFVAPCSAHADLVLDAENIVRHPQEAVQHVLELIARTR